MIIATTEAVLHKLNHIRLVTDCKLCTVEDIDLLKILLEKGLKTGDVFTSKKNHYELI